MPHASVPGQRQLATFGNDGSSVSRRPDIDRDEFKATASALTPTARGVMLYVSGSDLALISRRLFGDALRAGEVPDQGPLGLRAQSLQVVLAIYGMNIA